MTCYCGHTRKPATPSQRDYDQVAIRLRSLGLDLATGTCRLAFHYGISAQELVEACDYYERHQDAIGAPGALRLYVLNGGRWPKWVPAKIRAAAWKQATEDKQQAAREEAAARAAEQQRAREGYEALEARTGRLFDRLDRDLKKQVIHYVLKTSFDLEHYRRNPTTTYLRERILLALEEDPVLRHLYEYCVSSKPGA